MSSNFYATGAWIGVEIPSNHTKSLTCKIDSIWIVYLNKSDENGVRCELC